MEAEKTQKITPSSKIFSTGVHLQAVEVEINGKKQWRWIAVGFEDDTYFDGEIIDVNDYANTFEGLFKEVE
jgi:hypothetical protein